MALEGDAGFGGAPELALDQGEVAPGVGVLRVEGDGLAVGLGSFGEPALPSAEQAEVKPGGDVLFVLTQAVAHGFLGSAVVALAGLGVAEQVAGLGIVAFELEDFEEGAFGLGKLPGEELLFGEELPGEAVGWALDDGFFQGLARSGHGGGGELVDAELPPGLAHRRIKGDGLAVAVGGLVFRTELGKAETEQGPKLGAARVGLEQAHERGGSRPGAALLESEKSLDEPLILLDGWKLGFGQHAERGGRALGHFAQHVGHGFDADAKVEPFALRHAHGDEGDNFSLGAEHGGAGFAGRILAAQIQPARAGGGVVGLDEGIGQGEAVVFVEGHEGDRLLAGEVELRINDEERRVPRVALQDGEAGFQILRPDTADAVGLAGASGDRDVFEARGEVGMHHAHVGEQRALLADEEATPSGEFIAIAIPSAEGQHSRSDLAGQLDERVAHGDFGGTRQSVGDLLGLGDGQAERAAGRLEQGGVRGWSGSERGSHLRLRLGGRFGFRGGAPGLLGPLLFRRQFVGRKLARRVGTAGQEQAGGEELADVARHGTSSARVGPGGKREGPPPQECNIVHLAAMPLVRYPRGHRQPDQVRMNCLRFYLSLLALPLGAAAAEIDLKSLTPLETAKKKKSTAYVGVFLGQSQRQNAEMQLDYLGHSLDYDVADRNNDLLVGFEVGYEWRTKYPFTLGLEVEAFYGSTELDAVAANAANAGVPINLGDVATTRADMSYVAFMLNGTLALDLRRFRPQLGKYLVRFRPYVGGGIGGAQLWYRNQRTQTFGDLLATPTAPTATPFTIDEFVFVSQVFAGLQYQVNDKLDIYGEFRRLSFEKTNELSELETDLILGGLRLKY